MTHVPILEVSLAYRVHRAARLLRTDFLDIAASADIDLTPEQWFVLNKLRQRDGASQVELCDSLLDDRPNLTRILQGLERRALVRRGDDPEDGRRKLVHLTATGRVLHDTFAAHVRTRRDTLLGDLDPDDVAAVHRVLDTIESRIGRPGGSP